jgi:hypothetical protein
MKMLVSYFFHGEDTLANLTIIAWKGAAPTGNRKRAGSSTEELPSKKSKQGTIKSISTSKQD